MIKSVYNKKFNFSHERQFNKFFGTIKILISPPTFKMNKKNTEEQVECILARPTF